jgi:hypothetical protein
VISRFDSHTPTVEEMVAQSQVADAMDVEPNPKACNDYGKRCHFYSRCFPDANAGDIMSLLEKLKSNTGAASIPDPVPSTSATPRPEAGATSSTAPAGTLMLYIDILPEKGIDNVVRLEDEIARRVDAITKAHNVKSLYDAPLNFGKGRDLLVETFRTNPPTGIVLASSSGLYSAAIIEVLKPIAPIVCRGV